MERLFEVTGNVERFDGRCWEDVDFVIPIEVSLIADHCGWKYALVQGDVPIRWLIQDPTVKVHSVEGAVLV